MATLAPIPNARIEIATVVKAGFRLRLRSVSRTSRHVVSTSLLREGLQDVPRPGRGVSADGTREAQRRLRGARLSVRHDRGGVGSGATETAGQQVIQAITPRAHQEKTREQPGVLESVGWRTAAGRNVIDRGH